MSKFLNKLENVIAGMIIVLVVTAIICAVIVGLVYIWSTPFILLYKIGLTFLLFLLVCTVIAIIDTIIESL